MKKVFLFIYAFSFFLNSCQQAAKNRQTESGQTLIDSTRSSQSATNVSYTNPVMPGDYADPSVTKIGDTYWATATSSEWAPLFPLLKSTNLTDWETVGHVFPKGLPEWSEAHYWAPEINYENGKVYIYYTAKKKGGNLCVGVASATNPTGPYTDHGPLVCQEVGSIDGFPIRDENGQLYLIWKEDGNSQGKPTPIWGQRMNEARTALEGEKFELIRNDAPWEGGLVEGPALIKHGEYYYMFYAGDACCGKGCTYATGVARAKKLTGPWEKSPANPILTKNDTWKCPGHGTPVTDKSGNYYLLYHAYATDDFVYPGRQGLLDSFTWTADGWPAFAKHAPGASSNGSKTRQPEDFAEEFTADTLAPTWQWPVGQKPNYSFVKADGKISLKANTEKIGAVLAQRTKEDTYIATTAIDQQSLPKEVSAGIAAIGNPENAIGISVQSGKIVLWQVKENKSQTLAEAKAPTGPIIQLRLVAKDGNQYQFSYSTDGNTWNEVKSSNSATIDGAYLPPWDRGVRVGLIAKGPSNKSVAFDWFRLKNEE